LTLVKPASIIPLRTTKPNSLLKQKAAMKIIIFGASGRTGKLLVGQGLDLGHEITAFVRDPARLPFIHKNLKMFQGDIDDAGLVDKGIIGQEAVICAIGPTKDGSKNIMTIAAYHIITAMERHGVRRLVTLTGAGVRDPNDLPQFRDRAISAMLRLTARDVLDDAIRHVEAIRASDLDWVVVRAGILTDTPAGGEIHVGYLGKGSGPRISRADVATFMLQQLSEDTYLHQAPMISN
jgi:putative NADH-flavin reductase